jgi:hypothetical protein
LRSSGDLLGFPQYEPLIATPEIEIDPSHPKGSHFAVQLLNNGNGLLHVAIGANAFHGEVLSAHVHRGFAVAL